MERATRHNEGKLKWSLVHFDSFHPMVRVLEFGAEKYSIDNWKKGLYTKEICESMLRHIFAYLNGEDIDGDSKLSHVGHIQANAMFLGYMDMNMPEFDNRDIGKVRRLTSILNKYKLSQEDAEAIVDGIIKGLKESNRIGNKSFPKGDFWKADETNVTQMGGEYKNPKDNTTI